MKQRLVQVFGPVLICASLFGVVWGARLTGERAAKVTAWVTACDQQMVVTGKGYCTLPVP
jgi:hypothetical protein